VGFKGNGWFATLRLRVCLLYISHSEQIVDYREVKSLLLLGDHVEAVANLHMCENAGTVLPPGTYSHGYQVNIFSIFNDGS
jgi:hypothetical protein